MPVGHTVRNDDAVGSVTVTLRATAPTPVAGTPARPTTTMVVATPAAILPVPEYRPSIVHGATAAAVVVVTGEPISRDKAIPNTAWRSRLISSSTADASRAIRTSHDPPGGMAMLARMVWRLKAAAGASTHCLDIFGVPW